MLETGIGLRTIQLLLGRRRPEQAAIYQPTDLARRTSRSRADHLRLDGHSRVRSDGFAG